MTTPVSWGKGIFHLDMVDWRIRRLSQNRLVSNDDGSLEGERRFYMSGILRFKFFTALLLSLLLSLASAQGEDPSIPKDLPPGHWAEEAVRYLMDKGYLLGYPDGTFRGDKPVSRYELAVVLYRLVVTQPTILWDEGAMTWLRPLVKELVAELKEVDAKETPPSKTQDLGWIEGSSPP